ncbi:MAG TPA: DUF488 domain-containing protein [Peptococcaceae bacterium]|jgi:uncharacterized protein (DUF488 family)|nr:DUF488 domain-containing protein [Peptococcaceae bacterium]HQD53233.1 DUF488 domain-containing protein [Peptococcaceae bacterium]
MPTVYTIGHSVRSIDAFLKLLNRFEINCVIDVRSVPFSQYAPQYNIFELKNTLSSNGIEYLFMGNEFGAMQTNLRLYDSDGLLNFEKVMQSEQFQTGVKRVKEKIEQGFNLVFMCMEKDPMDCHRSILVGRAFHEEKYHVLNIMENGYIQSQEKLIKRLLKHYFSKSYQTTIFDYLDLEQNQKEAELIREVYRLRNKDIGYKLEENALLQGW